MAITPPDFTEANKKAMVISKITTAEFSCDESQFAYAKKPLHTLSNDQC